MEVKLTGWKGVASGIAILALLGFQFHAARASLDGAGREVIAQWLAAEYQRYHLARTDLDDAQRARLLLAAADVDIVALDARGKPESLAVRVEIAPGAAHPPGSPLVRYYRMEHSLLTGWHHRGKLRAWQYYLTLFSSVLAAKASTASPDLRKLRSTGNGWRDIEWQATTNAPPSGSDTWRCTAATCRLRAVSCAMSACA